jgi:hypothetical protein
VSRREYIEPAQRRRLAANEQFFGDVPACWTWSLPTEADLNDGDRACFIGVWQADRCAVCGISTPYSFVVDHDHETGLVRGYLCKRCNLHESGSTRLIYERYRLANPASVCGAEWEYAPPMPRTVLTEDDSEAIRRALDGAVSR